MANFEGKERRMAKIDACLAEYGMKTLEDAQALCLEKGIDVEKIVKGVQAKVSVDKVSGAVDALKKLF